MFTHIGAEPISRENGQFGVIFADGPEKMRNTIVKPQAIVDVSTETNQESARLKRAFEKWMEKQQEKRRKAFSTWEKLTDSQKDEFRISLTKDYLESVCPLEEVQESTSEFDAQMTELVSKEAKLDEISSSQIESKRKLAEEKALKIAQSNSRVWNSEFDPMALLPGPSPPVSEILKQHESEVARISQLTDYFCSSIRQLLSQIPQKT